MNAIGTQRNRYFDDRKDHTIFTPTPIASWLREILEPELEDVKIVFDPACGSGNLLEPFKDKITLGCDIADFGAQIGHFWEQDYLDLTGEFPKVDLITANPPYNHTAASAAKHGRSKLLPELFAAKSFELFGKGVKMFLFAPMGYRLNTRCYRPTSGSRYADMRDSFGEITSIVTLPLDVFANPSYDPYAGEARRNPGKGIMKSNIKRKETQQEIIFYNMPKLKPHYMLPETVIQGLRDIDRELWGNE
jgi:hypothetical protein